MADIFTKKKRSQIMQRIVPKGSKPEQFVATLIRSLSHRFVSHDVSIPGKPDFAFPRKRKAIFVNGCFWHGHEGCPRASLPATNRAFWKNKIDSNVRRDRRLYHQLRDSGWSVMVIWQCSVQKNRANQLKKRIERFINSEKRRQPSSPNCGSNDAPSSDKR
jgi:DNA mismatch endonuclease (patch repair protein)